MFEKNTSWALAGNNYAIKLDTEVSQQLGWWGVLPNSPCTRTRKPWKYLKHLYGELVEYLLPLLQATAILMSAWRFCCGDSHFRWVNHITKNQGEDCVPFCQNRPCFQSPGVVNSGILGKNVDVKARHIHHVYNIDAASPQNTRLMSLVVKSISKTNHTHTPPLTGMAGARSHARTWNKNGSFLDWIHPIFMVLQPENRVFFGVQKQLEFETTRKIMQN